MRYIFYVVGFTAFVYSGYWFILNDLSTSIYFAVTGVFAMQCGIFWKPKPVTFTIRRKIHTITIPKFRVNDKSMYNIYTQKEGK